MDISIVILTYQDRNAVERCLNTICQQKTDYRFEIICIDSGSTDGTIELCRKYSLRLFEIDNSEFNHASSRNFGISKANGRYIVLITQDALPGNELWLDNLVTEFDKDEKIAGAYCRQIPREDADCLTKRHLNGWLTARLEKSINYITDRKAYEALSPMEKYMFCNFDNVSSCIRKSVWEEFPFEKTYFGADLGWSKRVLEAGYKIMYQPESAVIHSHKRPILYEYKRTYLCHRRLYSLFKLQTVPSMRHVIRCYLGVIIPDTKFIIKNEKNPIRALFLCIRNLFLSFAVTLAQYAAVRNEKQGLQIEKIKGV